MNYNDGRTLARPAAYPRLQAVTVAYLALFVGSIVVQFYRLGTLPAFFVDEGLFLSTAATVADEHLYAVRSLYYYYAANISVGAPVILPLALAIRVAGESLLVGRVVIGCFALLALWLGARVAAQFWGRWAGPLAWWLILTTTWPFFLLFSRLVLGEVPALALVLAALLCWYHYLDARRWWSLVVAGIGFGLAAAAKPHMLLLVPTFGLLALLDLCYYRLLGLRHFIWLGGTALLTLLLCYSLQVINVGWDVYARDNLSMAETSSLVFNPDPTRLLQRSMLGFNQRTFQYLLILAALGYHAYYSRARNVASLKLAALLLLCALWINWHVFAATLVRYALIGNMLGMILVAGALTQLAPLVWARLSRRARRLLPLVVAAALLLPLPRVVLFLQADQPDGAAEMAVYIRTYLPPEARVETLEWGMDVLSGRLMGHMPIPTHLQIIEAHNYPDVERRLGKIQYDFRVNQPDYLLLGPTHRGGLPWYEQAVERGEAILVVRFEEYALYRLVTSSTVAP